MATVQGNISVTETFRQTTTSAFGGGQVSYGATQQRQAGISSGGTAGAADQADVIYTDQITLTASTPQTLDLTALTGGMEPGTKTFARVRLITITNLNTTDANKVTVGPGASNGWSAPGGSTWQLYAFPSTANSQIPLVIGAPNTTGMVVDSTHKTLKLDPGAATQIVDIKIVGCSA